MNKAIKREAIRSLNNDNLGLVKKITTDGQEGEWVLGDKEHDALERFICDWIDKATLAERERIMGVIPPKKMRPFNDVVRGYDMAVEDVRKAIEKGIEKYDAKTKIKWRKKTINELVIREKKLKWEQLKILLEEAGKIDSLIIENCEFTDMPPGEFWYEKRNDKYFMCGLSIPSDHFINNNIFMRKERYDCNNL